MAVLGWWAVSYERGTPVGQNAPVGAFWGFFSWENARMMCVDVNRLYHVWKLCGVWNVVCGTMLCVECWNCAVCGMLECCSMKSSMPHGGGF